MPLPGIIASSSHFYPLVFLKEGQPKKANNLPKSTIIGLVGKTADMIWIENWAFCEEPVGRLILNLDKAVV
jgi:hypothetical protein